MPYDWCELAVGEWAGLDTNAWSGLAACVEEALGPSLGLVYGWCNFESSDWSEFTGDDWDELAVCPDYDFVGFQPYAVHKGSFAERETMDYPFIDVIGTGVMASPVQASRGMFTLSLPLLAIPSLGGFTWRFTVVYRHPQGQGGNTPWPFESALGKNFTFPQDAVIEKDPAEAGEVMVRTPEMTRISYPAQGARKAEGHLFPSGDKMILTASDGTRTTFYNPYINAPYAGRISRIEDRFGNTMRYYYRGESLECDTESTSGPPGTLCAVVDGYGRKIKYSYDDPGYNDSPKTGRLTTVRDFIGRELNFHYDSHGRLTAAILPAVTERAAGDRGFPVGTAYVFEYDNDSISRVWYPNQCVAAYEMGPEGNLIRTASPTAGATPRYQVEYDDQKRVTFVTVADPEHGTGGTYSYLGGYRTYAPGEREHLYSGEDIRRSTEAYDRNGNKREYHFDSSGQLLSLVEHRNRAGVSAKLIGHDEYVTDFIYNNDGQVIRKRLPRGNEIEFHYYPAFQILGENEGYWRMHGLLWKRVEHGVIDSAKRTWDALVSIFLYEPLFCQLAVFVDPRGSPTVRLFDYQALAFADLIKHERLQKILFPETLSGATYPSFTNQLKDVLSKVWEFNEQAWNMHRANYEPMLSGGRDLNSLLTDDGLLGRAGPNQPFLLGSDLNAVPPDRDIPDIQGAAVRLIHPHVEMPDGNRQYRHEAFTVNKRGQVTTRTDPEGNITIFQRHPHNQPNGTHVVAGNTESRQYGWLSAVHVDVNPDQVLALVGGGRDGADMTDFAGIAIPGGARERNDYGYQSLYVLYPDYDQLGNVRDLRDARYVQTQIERNEMGAPIRVREGVRGETYLSLREFHYDANGNVIREFTEDLTVHTGENQRFTVERNGNTAHIPLQGGPGGRARNGWFVTERMFDLLDNVIEERIEAAAPDRAARDVDDQVLITRFRYDANENLIRIVKPEGNTVAYQHDERDLLIAEQHGEEPGSRQNITASIDVYIYDANGNRVQHIGPEDRGGETSSAIIEQMFEGGSGFHEGDTTTYHYDGFDRLVTMEHPNGTRLELTRDPAGHVLQETIFGATEDGGEDAISGTDAELSRTTHCFDEGGRKYETSRAVFLPGGQFLPSGRTVVHISPALSVDSCGDEPSKDNQATSPNIRPRTAHLTSGDEAQVVVQTIHDRADRVAAIYHDNGGITSFAYDGANRQRREIDPAGNQTEYEYDGNANVVKTVRTEKATDPECIEDEVFQTRTWHDALDRPVVEAAQGPSGTLDEDDALLASRGFDGRSNLTHAIDPEGNTQAFIYDSADRLIEEHTHLRDPENGEEVIRRTIVTTMYRDRNGQLQAIMDGNENITRYAYDSLDRDTAMILPDGSERTWLYNRASDVTEVSDENGSRLTYTYDAVGRPVETIIEPKQGTVAVCSTVRQVTRYDGLSRAVRVVDMTENGQVMVRRVYDSLDRLVEERQSINGGQEHSVTVGSFRSQSPAETIYPSDRHIQTVRDILHRRQQLEESLGMSDTPLRPIATWEFHGPNRIAVVALANQLMCSYVDDAMRHSAVQPETSRPAWGDAEADRLGYDGAGRPIAKRYMRLYKAKGDGGGNMSA